MFGDAYIRLRAQVGTALFSLIRLAQESHAPEATLAELQELQDGLREPFLFVTLGDERPGKSSMLNALFGRDFTDAPATTEKITVYRHGDEAAEVELRPGVIERRRAHLFLRDFTLVDTPAIGLRAEVTPELATYVTAADLLVFVFSATKPEADRSWKLLARLEPSQLKRVVLVADASGGGTLDEAARALRQAMLKRTSVTCPIFSIDTRGALAARIVGEPGALQASGIDKLEEFIDREVTDGLARRAPLDFARGRAREILKEVSGPAREAVHTSTRDGKLLAGMHGVIEERNEQSLRQLGGMLWSLAQTLEAAQKRGEEVFRPHLSISGVLNAGGAWRGHLEHTVEVPLVETVSTEIDSMVGALETDQRTAWEQLETQRRRTVVDCPQPQGPDFQIIRAAMKKDLESVLTRHRLDSGTDRLLHVLFFRAGVTMRIALFAVAVGGLLTGFAMFSALPLFDRALAATGIIAALGIVAHFLWKKRILAVFRDFSTARREALVVEVEEHLRKAIETFGEDLADSLGPVQVACAARKRAYEPMVARAQQLDELLAKARVVPTLEDGGPV